MSIGSGKWLGALLFGGLGFIVVVSGLFSDPGGVALFVRQVDTNHSYALLEFTNGTCKSIHFAGTFRAPDCHWLQNGGHGTAKELTRRRGPTGWDRTLGPGASISFWTRIPAVPNCRIGVVYWDSGDGSELWESAPNWMTRAFPWLKERHCHRVESPLIRTRKPEA